MGIRSFRPTSPSRRFQTASTFEELTTSRPRKSLTFGLRSTGGRNNLGRMTTRFVGGGNKKKYRIIDFRRDKLSIPGSVKTIEYDPNRNVRIALVSYVDGEYRYILAPADLKVGDQVLSAENTDVKVGCTMPLKNIPLGTFIHNIELRPGKGGQLVRAAGTGAQMMAKDKGYALIKLPSGELRLILLTCKATIGVLGNADFANISWGKAGRRRYLGRRPRVRGVAMNPVDHPMGGGEGKTSGGRHPCSPWGQKAKGLKTRKNKRTAKFIVKRRK